MPDTWLNGVRLQLRGANLPASATSAPTPVSAPSATDAPCGRDSVAPRPGEHAGAFTWLREVDVLPRQVGLAAEAIVVLPCIVSVVPALGKELGAGAHRL